MKFSRVNADAKIPGLLCNNDTETGQSVEFSFKKKLLIELMLIPPDEMSGYCCQTEYAEWLRTAMQHNFEFARGYLGESC